MTRMRSHNRPCAIGFIYDWANHKYFSSFLCGKPIAVEAETTHLGGVSTRTRQNNPKWPKS